MGYGNTQNVWTLVAAVFILTTAFFFSLLKLAFHI
jgi:hypothetical protein